MNLALYYIKTSAIDVLPYIPLVTVVRIAKIIYNIKKGKRTTFLHEVLSLLFVYYAAALFVQTISLKFLFTGEYAFDGNINLTPFKLATRMFKYAKPDVFAVNILGNIAIFVPLGVFMPLLRNEFKSLKRITALGFAVSLFIEVIQLFTPRVTDIDDLALNTLGAAIGGVIFKIGEFLAKPHKAEEKKTDAL